MKKKICCRCIRLREIAGGEYGGLNQFICATCVNEWHESEGVYLPINMDSKLIQAITDSIKALIPEPDDLESFQARYAAIWLLAEQQPYPVASVPEAPVLTNPDYWTCNCPKVNYKSFMNYCPDCKAWLKDCNDSLIVDVST